MSRALLISDTDEIEFTVVESENPTRTNQVTDNPVEQGVNIADHVKSDPLQFTFTGAITGDDAGIKYSRLVQMRDNRELLTYIGRNIVLNCVIESLSTTHDNTIRNGFTLSINLKQIRVAQIQFVDLSKVPIPARPKKKTGKQSKKNEETAAATNKLNAWIKNQAQ
jgi:hypothetical protein